MNIRILYLLFILVTSILLFSCDYKTTQNKALCSIEVPNGRCPEGKSCINGSCSIKCNPECENWQTCDNGSCETSEGRCLDESDCLFSNSTCEDHICKKNIDLCKDINCSNHGNCEVEEEKAKCICDDGYISAGLNCIHRDPCKNFTCGNNEICSAPNDIPSCVCEDGYIRNSENICIKDTPIDWSIECPDYISNSEQNPEAQCALVEVPLNYDDPNGEKIEIFIYRVLHTGSKNSGQVLFLQGGPGGSGVIFSSFFEEYKSKYPDFDLYSIDHRGVGNSVDLRCDNENNIGNLESFQRCTSQLNAEWGERLKQFSTNNAAKDLGFIFNKIKEDNVKQFLYGVSYGTYWAEKYLYFYPEQIDGVILDSIASINNTWMDDYNIGFQTVGNSFMEIVAQDQTATDKLSQYGETPLIALENFYTKIDNNVACDLGWNLRVEDWKTIFGISLRSLYSRVLIPSLLYRVHRCNTTDKAIIKTYIDNLTNVSGKSIREFVNEEDLDSDMLYYNVTFSELWKGNSLEQILEIEHNSLFVSSSVEQLYNFYTNGGWNTYLNDGTFRAWPDTTTPILMMNGTLDPQTPLEIALPSSEHFNKANQTFIEFPQSPHGVIMSSPMNDFESYCGEIILFDFLSDPTKKLDESCIANLYLLEFSADSQVNMMLSNYFYETDDMWEGTQTKNNNVNLELEKRIRKSFKIK